jgi:diguanylate cyclase (GGDEF)-like protein/PAS domain S-box-containing protein
VIFGQQRRLVSTGAPGWAPAPFLVAFIISIGVLAAAFSLDRYNSAVEQAQLRGQTQVAGAVVGRRLASRLQNDLAVAGFLARMYGETHTAPEAFKGYIRTILAKYPYYEAIGLAPDYQLADVLRSQAAGAESRLDLQRLAEDTAASSILDEAHIDTGRQEGYLTLTVPAPAFADDSSRPGAVVIVVDTARLLEAAQIALTEGTYKAGFTDFTWLDFALRDSAKPEYFAFLGNDAVQERAPLSTTIAVAGARWDLLLAPKTGWDVPPGNQKEFRLLLLAVVLAVMAPIFIAAYLICERNRHIAELHARENSLLDLSQRFNLAMEASDIGIWEIGSDGISLYRDGRAHMLHDSRCTDHGGLETWLLSVVPEDRDLVAQHFSECGKNRQAHSQTYRILLADGTVRYLRSAGAHHENDDGTRRTTGIVWDVTSDMLMAQTMQQAKAHTDIKNAELELALDELSERERDLEELSNKLELALASSGCGVWEYDPVTDHEHWDARMCQLFGIAPTDEPIHQDVWLATLVEEDRLAFLLSDSIDVEDSLVVRVPQPDGTLRYIRTIGKWQQPRNGMRKLIGLAFDVTQDALLTAELQKAKEEAETRNTELVIAKDRIEHNALHDPLTLLANRRKLDMELDMLSREDGEGFAILHLDLDRFKQINDTLGHAAGDAMLVHASRILCQAVSDKDLVARIGGDEFVILIYGCPTQEELSALADRIVSDFRQPTEFDGVSCRCGVSIGIGQARPSDRDAARVLVNADLALYRAKGLGRNRYEFFTQNLHAEIIAYKQTADELLTAIERDELVTWYQPQFCAQSNRLVGVEALIRWNHPERGLLTPDRFLKVADDLNITATIDRIVLETALKDKMRWAAMGIDIPRVSVNVSSKRLHDEDLIASIAGLQIRPGEISFELLESIFLDETDDVVTSNLEKIKELGIDIEIDDFGTGHTSIVSLLNLKPKRLKIDKQLVQPITGSAKEGALVASIIDIARTLGIETVAEGAETKEHVARLRELGCDILQGYVFSRPLPFDAFTRFMNDGGMKSAA